MSLSGISLACDHGKSLCGHPCSAEYVQQTSLNILAINHLQGYFFAWTVDLLAPTILGLGVVLILVPSVRSLLFPGLERTETVDGQSATDDVTGQPESHDSLTGAPEIHKGEAAEQEAKNLVDSFATVALESAAAKYGQNVTEDDLDRPAITDGLEAADAASENRVGDTAEDKTKTPMKKKVSHATDQVMQILSDVTDIYERFAK